MGGRKLLLASLAAAWSVAVVVAFFWLGMWVAATFGVDGAVPYWIFSWLAFASVAAVPFVVYTEAR